MADAPLDPSWKPLAKYLADSLRADPPLPKHWLSPAEAGKYIGIAERTLENWRAQGCGPKFSKVGHRTVKYHIDDCDAFLRERAA